MHDKAVQAHSQHSDLHMPVLSDSQADDEFAIFAGQTRLVSPEQPFTSPTPAPRQSHSKLIHRGQIETFPLPASPLDHRLLPHELLSCKPSVSTDSYLDTYQATFADLSGGWNGFFHEVPQSSYGFASTSSPHHMQPSGEGSMLDDRWTSFMHNYNIMAVPSPR
jgi:hypothetical protein